MDLPLEDLTYLKRLVKKDIQDIETHDGKSDVGRKIRLHYRKKVLKNLEHLTQ